MHFLSVFDVFFPEYRGYAPMHLYLFIFCPSARSTPQRIFYLSFMIYFILFLI